ncbi:hypothetical protein [Micromonospora zhanjiangensis]|uniref:Winged helix DNA-binding domain-containing protein n=1 Tax=Micromonospora zhanjiangensis TaxID=1522057 RepID=A0ABV8KKL1_9ACTN
MNDPVELAPYRFAALVAPAVDRICLGVLRAAGAAGRPELDRRYGGPAATGFLVDLRTRLAVPGGTVSGPGFAAVTRYADPARCQRALDKQVAHGMIYRTAGGGLCATERGVAYLTEIAELHARVTERLWDGHRARVTRLVGTVGRLLVRAARPAPADGTDPATGAHRSGPTDPVGAAGEPDEPTWSDQWAREAGSAFHALGPPYEPDGTPAGVLLLNRLSTLRYHRADAHAAAWTAAGHTARSISALPDGPERRAIELETDRRAAGPYRAIAPTERLELLADLAALPG